MLRWPHLKAASDLAFRLAHTALPSASRARAMRPRSCEEEVRRVEPNTVTSAPASAKWRPAAEPSWKGVAACHLSACLQADRRSLRGTWAMCG